MRCLLENPVTRGPVVYWMSRNQRVKDNWALLYAQQEALEKKSPLVVLFCLQPHFLEATWRQYYFMIEGLKETELQLKNLGITFILLPGTPADLIPAWTRTTRSSSLYCDFDPLKIKQKWLKELLPQLTIPVYQVDSSNIIPVWNASNKQEYAAYTLRPKINRLLPEYLSPFPAVLPHPFPFIPRKSFGDWARLSKGLEIDKSISPVYQTIPGETAAQACLQDFIRERLSYYHQYSNDPTRDNVSRLSGYLHFGQISAQRIALTVQQSDLPSEARLAFLEQLIIRRELSDNFCYYNTDYDNPRCFPDWAAATLREHNGDPREYLYSKDDFENARTHDALWNAAQMQMIQQGYMHGYMRMYWAKKILEWSKDVATAQQTAIYLNDRYQLDGRDPNGYTGIAWSMGGVHDRAWPSHPVFGKIRIMTLSGALRKFPVQKYIQQFSAE